MARRYRRASRGQRCRVAVPHSHDKTTTLTAGLRTSGLSAPSLVDGTLNGQRFRTYVEQVLAPALRPGDTVSRLPEPLRAWAARASGSVSRARYRPTAASRGKSEPMRLRRA